MPKIASRQIDVIAPNFKRRLSGVTSTIIRLVPIQARDIAIAATGPALPDDLPQIPLSALLTMSRRGPSGWRVWHARRNVEMLAGLALRRLLGKRLKLLFTSASQRQHSGYTKWLIAQMDDVIATSARTAAYLERPAHVVHHGIDCGSFHPAADKPALRAELGLPVTGPLIGCFGRIRAQKGTDVFVDAMIDICRTQPDVTGLVMGGTTDSHKAFLAGLKNRVAEAGLDGRILFLPEVPVWETARFYQVLDLYVAPQRWEGFGLTPIEAMACAVPVVATRVGAFEELIVEGETGRLVAADDLPALTAAVADLLVDPDALPRMAPAARTHVEAQFRIETEAARLNAIYRRLLGSEAPA
ncbi:glycosyltransferase family 4 protein [Pseudodonghicola flavimaris]|uniref:Glycosyltransferase family 4 protein n=1 Tax=Pseudodonghicola flavimaris TaxID=3050036 RepID=A0ABT7EV51_9RHOB|nr:glycosyltransferase family 4 protein [Pseudodonghicola flavimaris]MDK3016169.1 glycosyltransferase family 4 protein [Pseudodonghicola flavimaris]